MIYQTSIHKHLQDEIYCLSSFKSKMRYIFLKQLGNKMYGEMYKRIFLENASKKSKKKDYKFKLLKKHCKKNQHKKKKN